MSLHHCDFCEREVKTPTMSAEADGKDIEICKACASDNFIYCDVCGSRILNTEIYLSNETNQYICQKCLDKMPAVAATIPEYHKILNASIL